MTTSLLFLFAGIIIGIFINNLAEIKHAIKRHYQDKRYKKLLNGIPKRVMQLNSFYDAFDYRYHAFYINGQVLGFGAKNARYFHCNDESMMLFDKHGKKAGYLTTSIVRSHRLAKNKWQHEKALVVTENPNFLGRRVNVDVILDIY